MSHLVSPFMLRKAIDKLAQHGMKLPAGAARQEIAQAIAMVLDKPMPKQAADMGALIRSYIATRHENKAEKFKVYNPWPTMGEAYKRIRMDFAYKGVL